jgi:ABC-type transport system involved in cytochrome c biogenesis ATPase subunit
MIHSIDIRNFRCFERELISDCRRVNMIVGDNGVGKTALLEALFLALASTPEVALRFRQMRGLEGQFAGPPRRIEEALWQDLFYKSDWRRNISIETKGEGEESRQLIISRGPRQLFIPLSGPTGATGASAENGDSPISFTWRDHRGTEHPTFPKITSQGLQTAGGDEDLPNFFYFAANQTIQSIENAMRFSELSRGGRLPDFIKLFKNEYKWVDDLSIEVIAGAPVIYATLSNGDRFPVAYISGGVNRLIAIMLAIASREKSVVLVDEIENGIYHKHHMAMWRGLLGFAQKYDSQLFLTTHSGEWLDALSEAAADEIFDDIALWRIQHTESAPVVRQFFGKQVISAIKAGEVR